MKTGHTLILGGARSGKSLFGERLARHFCPFPAYIATAGGADGDGGQDEEMARRIALHRKRRGNDFVTFEEPLKLAEKLQTVAVSHETILVDCLTLWLSNLMLSDNADMENSIAQLLDVLAGLKSCKVILVSNEVGMGVVPEHEMGRIFRDRIGELHQQLGRVCAEVYFVTAGLPMALKGELPELD